MKSDDIIVKKKRQKETKKRDVAQLVAHYVRDVGVGRSSRLIPTKSRKRIASGFFV